MRKALPIGGAFFAAKVVPLRSRLMLFLGSASRLVLCPFTSFASKVRAVGVMSFLSYA